MGALKNIDHTEKVKIAKETSYWTLYFKYLPQYALDNPRVTYYSREIEFGKGSEEEAFEKAYGALMRLRIKREQSGMVDYTMLFRNEDNMCLRVWLPNQDGYLTNEQFQKRFAISEQSPKFKLWLATKWDAKEKLGWEKPTATWQISDIDPQRNVSGVDVYVKNCILALRRLGSSMLAKATIYQQLKEVHESGPFQGKPKSEPVAKFNQHAQLTILKTDLGNSFRHKLLRAKNYPIESLGITTII